MGRGLEGFFPVELPDVVTASRELTHVLRLVESPPPESLAATRGGPNWRSFFWRQYLLNTDLIDQMLSP
jgi:hypothetical protein